ncbi:MAG: Crp/Fnr family transcriptional regulator [Fimbriimonas sp.]
MSLEEAIKGSYLAVGFSGEDLEALYEIAECCTYEDGEVILRQFDETKDIYILASGRAHIVTILGDPIGVIKPGMPVGEISFLDGRPRSVSVVAVGPTDAVSIPYDKAWALLKERPAMELAMMRNISRLLCARMRSANNNIAALMAIEESEGAILSPRSSSA